MNNDNQDFKELQKKVDEAIAFAGDLQNIGQNLSNVSEQMKKRLNHAQFSEALGNEEAKKWFAAANATVPYPPYKAMAPLKSYYYAISTTSASTMVVLPFDLQQHHREHELDEGDLKELDSYLRDFITDFPGMPDLVSFRQGAWRTFHSKTEVNLMNASHDMREILRNVISKIATNDDLRKAEWWTNPNPLDKGASGKQRLRYLIFGPLDDSPTEMVEMTISKWFKAYSRLQQIAHGSREQRTVVEEYLQMTEYTLLTIFRYRKMRAYGERFSNS